MSRQAVPPSGHSMVVQLGGCRVIGRVCPDQLRLQIGAIIESDGHVLSAIEDVIVGDNKATCIDDLA
jgi:hypothetical protein